MQYEVVHKAARTLEDCEKVNQPGVLDALHNVTMASWQFQLPYCIVRVLEFRQKFCFSYLNSYLCL